MDLKQLREALKAGTITLEQYRTQAKAIIAGQLSSNTIDQAEHDRLIAEVEAQKEDGSNGGGSGGGISAEDLQAAIDKAVQSATDKVRTELSKKAKDAEEELERLRRDKLTDEERAKLDREKAEKDIADREAKLQAREVQLHIVDVLTKKELPLGFRDWVAGATIEETDTRIESFSALWAKELDAAVKAKFKENGGDPGQGRNGNGNPGDENPFKRGPHFNLTKQGELMRTNPELAQKYKTAAGV